MKSYLRERTHLEGREKASNPRVSRPRRSAQAAFVTAAIVLAFASFSARAAERPQESIIDRRMEAEEPCFSGAFATYDSWIASIKRALPSFDPVAASYPTRSTFDGYQRDLDCKWILYPSADGQLVNGFVIVPKKLRGSDVRLPIIIYNRGGSGVAQTPVVMGALISRFLPLAAEGFVVAGSQYRGLRSRLLGPNRDPGRDEFGGTDVGDVETLIELVASLPNTDSTKIGLYGWSRGGMQSFLVARDDARIKAVVVGGAVSDLSDWRTFRPEVDNIYAALIPVPLDQRDQALRERSVVQWAERLPSAPILLIHGLSDERVPFRQSIALSNRLQELGRAHELVLIGGGDHGLTKHAERVDELTLAWFKRYLK